MVADADSARLLAEIEELKQQLEAERRDARGWQTEFMGRFFVAAQSLLLRGEMSLLAIGEIRNALYGPSVPPVDLDDIPQIEQDLRLPPRRRPWWRRLFSKP
jgi:hypothetical protein